MEKSRLNHALDRIVHQNRAEFAGATFCGAPLVEMTNEQLMAAVLVLGKQNAATARAVQEERSTIFNMFKSRGCSHG